MNLEKYKYRKSIVLTRKEGELLEKILKEKKCNNISQLLKLIIKKHYLNQN